MGLFEIFLLKQHFVFAPLFNFSLNLHSFPLQLYTERRSAWHLFQFSLFSNNNRTDERAQLMWLND